MDLTKLVEAKAKKEEEKNEPVEQLDISTTEDPVEKTFSNNPPQVNHEPLVLVEQPKEPFIDIRDIQLSEEDERKAQDESVAKAVAWMKLHPKYTLDELRNMKAKFLQESREEIALYRSSEVKE